MIVILDNGHGHETPGKRSPKWSDGSQLFEYEFNRDIVNRIARMMEAEGLPYKILVPEIKDVPLSTRCQRANAICKANNGKCVLFSIHSNAGGGTGYEVYTTKGQTAADPIATILFKEMEGEFGKDGWKMRSDNYDGDPDKESQFYILRHTICPALLSENFFMDNETDCRELFKDDFKERIAKAHFAAIKKICLT